jgi:hypothetical protein
MLNPDRNQCFKVRVDPDLSDRVVARCTRKLLHKGECEFDHSNPDPLVCMSNCFTDDEGPCSGPVGKHRVGGGLWVCCDAHIPPEGWVHPDMRRREQRVYEGD